MEKQYVMIPIGLLSNDKLDAYEKILLEYLYYNSKRFKKEFYCKEDWLIGHLGISRRKLQYSIQKLKDEGYISTKRKGIYNLYQVNEKKIEALFYQNPIEDNPNETKENEVVAANKNAATPKEKKIKSISAPSAHVGASQTTPAPLDYLKEYEAKSKFSDINDMFNEYHAQKKQ